MRLKLPEISTRNTKSEQLITHYMRSVSVREETEDVTLLFYDLENLIYHSYICILSAQEPKALYE